MTTSSPGSRRPLWAIALCLSCSLWLAVACGGDGGGGEPMLTPDADADVAAADTSVTDTGPGDTQAADTEPVDADVAADTDVADVPVSSGCTAQAPEQCLYLPADDSTFEIVTSDALSDPDRVGQAGRPIPLALYRPLDVAPPWPVVLLSHGGAGGKTNPLNSMEHWAPRLARAGYLAVAIAHVPRDADQRLALCAELGADMAQCEGLKFLNYDRPHDVRLVIDQLETWNASGEFAGELDLSRLAYMGHSAGAGATQMVAGAGRVFVDAPVFLDDPRPAAFVSMSPQGIDVDGFYAESWQGVTRPVLVGTGLGDGGSAEVSTPRRDPFLHSAAGDKHLVWIEHQAAQHTVFEGSRSACLGHAQGSELLCDRMQQLLTSSVLAFLDTYLRDDAAAAAWLASDALVTAAGELPIEWLHR